MVHDQWLCLCYQNPDDRSKINDREVQKNTHIKSSGQCKDKYLKKNSYISLHKNDCKTPYIDIYIDLLSINLIYCPHFSIMLTIRSVMLKSTLH